MENHRTLIGDIQTALRNERPSFHGQTAAGTRNWSIGPEILNWMEINIPRGAHTLETGCGYSTVVLSSLAGSHTVVAPFSQEHALIKKWCDNHGVPMDHVNFIAKRSQEVLPQLGVDDLGFVLIDGDHAFPIPFIDFYYTAEKIRKGGFIAVDDTQIRTGQILRDFLDKEAGRWHLAAEVGKTAIFERTTDAPVITDIRWMKQEYCKIPRKTLIHKIEAKLSRLIRN